jgi:hypothetical protein
LLDKGGVIGMEWLAANTGVYARGVEISGVKV